MKYLIFSIAIALLTITGCDQTDGNSTEYDCVQCEAEIYSRIAVPDHPTGKLQNRPMGSRRALIVIVSQDVWEQYGPGDLMPIEAFCEGGE